MSKYLESREVELFDQQRGLIEACGLHAPLIFDVGANVGQSIRRYREAFPGCVLHSFEPIPALQAGLIYDWNGKDGINIHPIALAAQPGEMDFHITRLPEASSLLKPDPLVMSLSQDGKYDYETIIVQCESLDLFCQKQSVDHIDILKIDVQGAELQVLQGGRDLLRLQKISQVYMEVNLAEGYEGQASLSEVLSYFGGYGYHLWDFLPFVYTSAGQAWTANALFVSPNLFAQITHRPAV